MRQIAKSTGFFVTLPETGFLEAAIPQLANPSEEYNRSLSSYDTPRDHRIGHLVKMASSTYLVDGLVKQVVDKYSELFKEFSFEGGDKQVKYLKNRFVEISLQTGEHYETFFSRVITEYFKTGNAFIVKRRGGNPKAALRPLYKNKPYTISGYSIISPDRLAVSRNREGAFAGWELRNLTKAQDVKLVMPGALPLDKNKALINITVLPDKEKKNALINGVDLIQIAYKKPADSNYGFGMTLAGIEDIALLRTIEKTTSIMIKKFSNPIIHHKILRPASPLSGMQNEINMAYQLYRQGPTDGVIVTGGNAEIRAIGSESQALRTSEYLHFFVARALAGVGTSPFLMGMEAGSQGTAEAAVEQMMNKVRYCQKEISREMEFFILNELLWEGGFDPFSNEEDRVKLVFEDMDQDRTVKMQTHAADLYTKGVLGLPEARNFKGKIEGKHKEEDLYLNKVDIPRLKAKAKFSPEAKPKAKTKPKRENLRYILPTNEDDINLFLNILEIKYETEFEDKEEIFFKIKNLIGDPEAILEYTFGEVFNG
jgi:hypothetical protein